MESNYSNNILDNKIKLHEKLAGDLAEAFSWNREKVLKLIESISENIYAVLKNKYISLYYDSEWDKRYIIVDNMLSDVIKKIIENRDILKYDEETEKIDDNDLKIIIQGIPEDDTVRPDPESAEEYLRAHKLNKPRPGELAGRKLGELAGTESGELAGTKSGELAGRTLGKLVRVYGRKGGKLSKNNKKKSKRKHQNNKKSHKKRR